MSGLAIGMLLKNDMKKLLGIFYKLQFYLFDVRWPVSYFTTAPSQLFGEGK